mgnify:CR=1 FL=1
MGELGVSDRPSISSVMSEFAGAAALDAKPGGVSTAPGLAGDRCTEVVDAPVPGVVLEIALELLPTKVPEVSEEMSGVGRSRSELGLADSRALLNSGCHASESSSGECQKIDGSRTVKRCVPNGTKNRCR